jgi:xylose isomerase-like TIM barrel protein
MSPARERGGVKFGVSSYAAIKRPIADAQNELSAFGVPVELMCEPPHAWPAPVQWTDGTPLSLHAPIHGVNIASVNPGIREESVRQVVGTVQEAARLGADGVVVHPGSPPYEEILPRDRGLPYAIESLTRIAEAAGAAGVEIYLENMPQIYLAEGAKPFQIGYAVEYDELIYLFEQARHPAMHLCLDLGHAFLAGRHVLDGMLKDTRVTHVHVSDNHGRKDDHLAWGDGAVSKVVDLSRDLPSSVRAIVCEHGSIETTKTSLSRVLALRGQRGMRS